MEQFSGLNMDMEQAMAGAAFEDCGQENPFDDRDAFEGQVDMQNSSGNSSSMESDAFLDDEDECMDEEESSTEEELSEDGSSKAGIPPKKPDQDDAEDEKRVEHEAAEARRKAEWEARQQAKRDAEQAQIERIASMSDEELMAESMKRVGTDTEKLTRRNMKECVAEYIQTLCVEDPAFARLVMNPKKNMVRCFQYISRKAWEYVQDELKANGIQPERGMQPYGCDLPDDLCYHWAEEYFRTSDVKEDQEEEEKFVPKPYCGGTSSKSKTKKKGEKKKTTSVKPEIKKTEKKTAVNDGQLSFIEQLSSGSMASSEVKAAG